MRITFQIHYHTKWGEKLVVLGSQPELGNQKFSDAFPLHYLGDGFWGNSLELSTECDSISYKYLVVDDYGNLLDEDWGDARIIPLKEIAAETVLLKDSWRSKRHPENAFYSSAFLNLIFKADKVKSKSLPAKAGAGPFLRFQVRVPRIEPDQQICVLGSTKALGNWSWNKPLLLGSTNYPLWSGTIAFSAAESLEYKYGVYDRKQKKVLFLEEGPNRQLIIAAPGKSPEALVLSDEYFNHPKGNWKGAGVAIPVFSLRSKQGFGVGQFTDLLAFIDWAKALDMKMVQILPINDTSATKTWVDSYPYAAISVSALHPLYLDLCALKGFEQAVDQQEFEAQRRALNQLETVDYERVMDLKVQYARQIFIKQKRKVLRSAAFKKFFTDHKHWLRHYALFCYLRDQYETVDFSQWGADSECSEARLEEVTAPKAPSYDSIAFYYYLQFQLHLQLKQAADYARANGLILKGDIPIGIYRHSVDAWVQPELYNMDGQAGAPPDPFSDLGQNWGFPTYNWAEMAKDDYQWWQNRLKQLSHYFDAFRIDHILGFFRIWQIPYEQIQGTLGFFNPAIPITLKEFADRGIAFDYERFCEPFITEHLLKALFEEAEDQVYVKNTFLQPPSEGLYRFRENLDTQRKIKQFLETPDQKGKAHLQPALFDLVGNFLFMEVPNSDGEAFHPRIDFQKTASFRALDWDTSSNLEKLYIDYFYGLQEDFWRMQAMVKLPVIRQATNMLICGEDLGMVPDCVPGVMDELGLLTLEIQRMSKKPESEFLQSKDIPYLSVCSPSTHDMSPIRAWWEENDWAQIQRFYQQELHMEGIPPTECSPFMVEFIIRRHLGWPGMWAVFPLQDLLGMSSHLRHPEPLEERINEPSNPQHYWRYRMHLTVEDLQQASTFNRKIQQLLVETGRA